MKIDNDIAEIGEAIDKDRKDRKAIFRSGKMLEDIKRVKSLGLTIEEKNDSEHFIIHNLWRGKIQKVDYWPSTQKWKFRDSTLRGYGVDGLIKNLLKAAEEG